MPFADPDGRALHVGTAVQSVGVAPLRSHPAVEDGQDGDEEDGVARDPHDPGRELLVFQRRGTPGAGHRDVVRVEGIRRAEEDHGEEGVLRQLQEHVHRSDGVGHAPGRRILGDRRPPEQERAAQEQHVLQVVDEGVFKRCVEERREMAHPHDRSEGQPGDHREREHARHACVQDGQDPATTGAWICHPEEQGDRRGERDERCCHQREQDVLDHVDGKQRRVVGIDAGQQRDGDGAHAEAERDRPTAGHGIGWMTGIDPADGPPPGTEGDRDAEGRQRLERPAEEE